MERMLVTGASGFLGSRITEYFRGKYDIFAPSHREMDIKDEKSVAAVLDEWKPDVVVHCAAVSDVERCSREPEESWRINVDGSVKLAKESGRIGAKCILCSSDQVYVGSRIPGPHREEEALSPGNLYGREKLEAEEKCAEVNPDCILLRLSWMYDGRTLKETEHGDFMRSLLAGMKNGEKLRYPVHDRRGITDVNEVIRNLEKAFTLKGGVYNFGSPNEKRTYDTVCGVFQKLGWDTGRLEKNEEAFSENLRDITMDQRKLNAGGIFFRTTEEGILAGIREYGGPAYI